MLKFAYGVSDFYKIISGGFFYCDRTQAIPDIEAAGEQLLFLRPRRFGKSLLLSTSCPKPRPTSTTQPWSFTSCKT